jgi:hypothetical protein
MSSRVKVPQNKPLYAMMLPFLQQVLELFLLAILLAKGAEMILVATWLLEWLTLLKQILHS